MACDKFLTLNNGLKMPALGIGTWQASDAEIESAIDEALTAGYRLIDTAPVYLNEKAIGRVLRKWFDSGKLKREELFVTTKLPPIANRPDEVEATLRKSLSDLQLDYVDLYLIHCPFGAFSVENGDFKRDDQGRIIPDLTTDHAAVWKKMEGLVSQGLIKSIGLSNFNQAQVEKLLKNCVIRPANLQIEHHIYLQQRDLINFCKKEGIVVTAYAPLGSRGIAELDKKAGFKRELPDLMNVPEVKALAEVHNKTPAQILIRWIVDNGIATIPKSTNSERLRQNLDIFDFALTSEEVQKLNALDANIRICNFGFFAGIETHPEFPF